MTTLYDDILASVSVLPKEYITVANALGRIIAEPVKAHKLLPETDIAAVDGYAVCSTELSTFPIRLVVQGESNSAKAFSGTLKPEHAIRTLAGGKIADGADALVAASKVVVEGDVVTIQAPPSIGENICQAGVDFSPADVAFPAGTVMNARLTGLASAMHLLWLPVVRKPRIAVLAVGSELAMPGEATATHPITASSLYTIPANIAASCGDPIVLGIALDSVDNVVDRIKAAGNCDLLITTGGTSVGAGNLMDRALERISSDVHVLRTELKRNDHMLFTRYNGMPICSLPGNPTSSSIYFTLFAYPIIRKMLGISTQKKHYAVLARTLDEHDTSVAYLHASLTTDSAGLSKVIPVSAQDGFLLSSLAKSDCLIVVNQSKNIKKGDMIEYIPLSNSLVST